MSDFACHYQRASRPIDRWGEPPAAQAWYAHDWMGERPGKPGAFGWLAAGLLVLWTALTTGYIILQSGQAVSEREAEMRLRSAYETRISRLRSEIDSINGRLMLNQDAFEDKLKALRQRQKYLESRQNMLSDLIDEAAHPAIQAAAILGGSGKADARSAEDREVQELRLAFTPRPSIPAPVAHDRATAARLASAPDGHGFAVAATNPADHALVRLSRAQDRLEASQYNALEALEARAEAVSRTYRNIMSDLGMEMAVTSSSAQAGKRTDHAQDGMGGPFVPMVLEGDRPHDPFEGRLSRVRELIFTSAELYDGLLRLPARAPIAGKPQITSGFGMRRDPFLGSMAMHSGLDFRASHGEPVLATADGRITFAAVAGGYGKLVEIAHASGFVSRYAHLSAILVRPGQKVRSGQRIGKVGSTGRSTGPHLHYELKLDDSPVNPRRYLAAADLLAKTMRTSRKPEAAAR